MSEPMDKREEIELPISAPTVDDMETGLEMAHKTPGCYLKTQGDCNFAARFAERERQLKAALLASQEKDAEIARLKHEYSKFSSLHDANPLSGLSGGGLNVLGDQPSMKVDDLAVKACRDAGWPNTEECRTQALAMMRTIQNQYVVYVEKGK